MKDDLTVIGLTGGIASGKSTAAGFMRSAGLPVIDADQLGHMALEPDGIAYEPVVERFGREILGADGKTIDRQKLGAVVFDNPERRRELEAITHPAIGELAGRGLHLVRQRGGRLAVYEAALLVETGIHAGMAALVTVSCSLERQMERLCARNGFTREAAAVRIASQLPLAEKVAVSDYVLENDGTPEELAQKVRGLMVELEERFGPLRVDE